MSWRTITETDLKQALSADELTAIRESGLGADDADPIAGEIAREINYIHGYIRANPANRLGPAGTLPESLIKPACAHMAVDICTRVAGFLIDPNNLRKAASDAALRLFEQVSSGSYAVEQPAELGTEQGTKSSVQQAGGSTVTVSRVTLAGL